MTTCSKALSFLRMLAVGMGPVGLSKVVAGWITTEGARQPCVDYGILHTENAVSNYSVTTLSVTLTMFIVMYFPSFGIGTGFKLRMVAGGPEFFSPDATLPTALKPCRCAKNPRPIGVERSCQTKDFAAKMPHFAVCPLTSQPGFPKNLRHDRVSRSTPSADRKTCRNPPDPQTVRAAGAVGWRCAGNP
ncbi:cytochrome ubiquinol oxidase subunit I [Martelella mediterranea]|uniref:Bacterial Cytochrome Ubiquinol Oxidase n=1 Tax=Martelella mediterranea DSM 17316 TaxID=1122214 RepID=A0A1U9ZA89_9HYPH|nr:cytochrome ubiquinol oxidase subunit I [Martelella mediterranea]AQZ54510.1 Bacterial Cytochrome Ubiquinol Oxidase [Martelella mediterranea DSM 17316]